MSADRLHLSCALVALVAITSCATSGKETGASGGRSGSSGSVAWQVADMHKDVAGDGREVSWRYTIVLKELSGHAVQFAKHYRSFQHPNMVAVVNESKFERSLAAKSELRVPWMFREHPIDASREVVQRGGGIQAWHRFAGDDDRGQPVTIDVRFDLD